MNASNRHSYFLALKSGEKSLYQYFFLCSIYRHLATTGLMRNITEKYIYLRF